MKSIKILQSLNEIWFYELRLSKDSVYIIQKCATLSGFLIYIVLDSKGGLISELFSLSLKYPKMGSKSHSEHF